MCRGSYKPVGSGAAKRPAVQVGVWIPAEHDQVVWQDFLIDTGADATAITRLTERRLRGLPTHGTRALTGVGTDDGEAELFTGDTTLALPEPDGNDDVYHAEPLDELAVIEDAPVNLLGRDVLDRFVTRFDPGRGTIELTRREDVSPAHETVRLSE